MRRRFVILQRTGIAPDWSAIQDDSYSDLDRCTTLEGATVVAARDWDELVVPAVARGAFGGYAEMLVIDLEHAERIGTGDCPEQL